MSKEELVGRLGEAIEKCAEESWFANLEGELVEGRRQRLMTVREEVLDLFDVSGWDEKPKDRVIGEEVLYLMNVIGEKMHVFFDEDKGEMVIVTDVGIPLIMMTNLRRRGAEFIELKGQPLTVMVKIDKRDAMLE